MSTTSELLLALMNLEMAQEEVGDDPDLIQNLMEARDEIKNLLIKKTDNIDKFVLDLKNKEAIIDAQIKVVSDETSRLRNRKKSILRTKNYFTHNLIPTIIREIGDNNKLETPHSNYTAFEKYSVKEWEEELLDEKFIITTEIKKIDKILAKKKAIEEIKAGKLMPGCVLEKVWNVKRS